MGIQQQSFAEEPLVSVDRRSSPLSVAKTSPFRDGAHRDDQSLACQGSTHRRIQMRLEGMERGTVYSMYVDRYPVHILYSMELCQLSITERIDFSFVQCPIGEQYHLCGNIISR